RDANRRQILDAAADSERRPAADPERIDGHAEPASRPLELEDVDVRGPITCFVLVVLELRSRDFRTDEIGKGVLAEVERLRVEPIEADADELPPRLGRRVVLRLSDGAG